MKQQRLIALFILTFLLLTYPLLALFNQPVLIAGFPLLYLYLFVVWVATIACIAVIVRASDS